MEEMQKAVLRKALTMLMSLKCQFAVIDPDGQKHGDLEVLPPKPPRKPRTNSGIKYKVFYEERVKLIEPSDVIHEFIAPEGIDADNLRSAMCGWCSTHWGNETYSTQVKDGKILLMRYA